MKKIGSLVIAIFLVLNTFAQKDAGHDEAIALVKAGMSKVAMDNCDEAIKDFNAAMQKDPKCLDAYLKRAFCYSKNGNFQAAIDDYTKVIELKPDNSYAYVSRGSAKNKLKMFKEAMADFDKALQLKPDDCEAYNNRGFAKKGLGDDDGACKDWHYSKKKGNDEAKIILQNNRCK